MRYPRQSRYTLNKAVQRRVISETLKYTLICRGLLDDLVQEILATEHEGRGLSDIEYMRLLNRNLYRFLRNYGFRRTGNRFVNPAIPFSILEMLDGDNKEQLERSKLACKQYPTE